MASLEKRSSLYRIAAQDESMYMKWMVSKTEVDEKTENVERYLRELVYLSACKLSSKIPKQIMCVDEKYLRNCLEMIHVSAGKISLCTSSLKTGISLEGFVFPLAENESVKCALPNSLESVYSTPPGQWIIGSINGSKSMKNILNHPMLHRPKVLEDDNDDSDFEFRNSGSHSIICSPQKLNRFHAASGIDLPEQPLSNLGAIVSHGMLQCNLTDDNPQYIFSVDENREVYEASLLSTGMYSFNLHNGRRKEGQVASTKQLSHVGTMKVSAHFSTCPNNFKVLETEFVLYGLDEKTQDESMPDPLSQNFQMKKGLSKKFTNTFKPSLSVRKRTKSVFWRTSSTTDSCPWSPPIEVHKTSEKQIQRYCEIASIITRKHLSIPPKEVIVAEPGGWGASILKRVAHKEIHNFPNPVITSKSHRQCSNGNCSTTDIIIPAGYHTQPETEDCVPSSLIERWKSRGQCDCGGWDIGCPLTVFTTRTNKNAALGPGGNQKDCSSFDVVSKGTEKHPPPQMKMVNISSDLYYLNFGTSLSALQSFAIAVAVLHCKNNTLQTKMVQELESRSVEVGECS